MDILQETRDSSSSGKTFFSHVFSTTDEGKAELLNVVQYACLGIIPVVVLNKSIQRFVPDADTDSSSIELLAEILIQIIVMFCGIVIIHRIITYVPTYSGFKYEYLTLTNVILAFLILVLSIQTKLGIKVNILVDRLGDLWNGTTSGGSGDASDGSGRYNKKQNVRITSPMTGHSPSQADYLDNSNMQPNLYPPAPVAVEKPRSGSYDMMRGSASGGGAAFSQGPMAANGILGGSFGSSF